VVVVVADGPGLVGVRVGVRVAVADGLTVGVGFEAEPRVLLGAGLN
jgi:hypothetical protein